jgi:hypothetical protein
VWMWGVDVGVDVGGVDVGIYIHLKETCKKKEKEAQHHGPILLQPILFLRATFPQMTGGEKKKSGPEITIF